MASEYVLACSKALAEKKWKIAFIESATAGRMSYEFSKVPDSGKILLGGMVCYDACLKEEILEIPHGLIDTFTPESAEVTQAMAINASRLIKAEVCVAVTGLTTPGGSETKEKPVGTMFVHIVMPEKHLARKFEFNGGPEAIVRHTIEETAKLIIKAIAS